MDNVKVPVGSIIAVPPEKFAGSIELANTKIEYLRLLGIEAGYNPDINLYIIDFGGVECSRDSESESTTQITA